MNTYLQLQQILPIFALKIDTCIKIMIDWSLVKAFTDDKFNN